MGPILYIMIFVTQIPWILGKDGLHFLVIGDWGKGSKHQRYVARAMKKYAERTKVDFIISTGDNFYNNGVKNTEDKKFEELWKEMYDGSLSSTKWYLSLGNHDHHDNPNAQINYSRNDCRWNLPDYKYSWISKAGKAKVMFISYDSHLVMRDRKDKKGIAKYVDSKLASKRKDKSIWKIVFGHHPAYSCASREPNEHVIKRIISSMIKNKADVYFAGHEHNMQHLKNTDDRYNIEHVISGGGGADLYDYNPYRCKNAAKKDIKNLHFSKTHGFVAVTILDKKMTVSFIDENGKRFYSFSRIRH